MSLTKLFRDFPILPHFVLPLVLSLAVCGALGGWLREHDNRVAAQAQFVAKLQHARETTAQWENLWAKAADSLSTKSESVTVTRTKYRTIRDTVIALYERSDSMVFAENLPAFVHASDDAIHACTEYQNACEVYKHVSDSLVASLRSQIALEDARLTPRVPRLRLTGDALYDPLTQTPALGAGLDLRVAGPFSLTVQGIDRLGDTPHVYVGVRGVF